MRDETELEAVRRARDFVLANISHEFRTPLAAQLASIELLQDDLRDISPERARRTGDVAAARHAAPDAADRQPARERAHRVGPARHPRAKRSPRRGGQDAAELIGSLLPQRGQTLEVNVPEDLPSITGDAPRLMQVFVNLLANANKFGPEGSVIRVGAVSRGDSIEAWVEDEGPGMVRRHTRLDFRSFLPCGRPGAGTARTRPRALDRQVDRRTSRRYVSRRTGPTDGRTRFSITLPAGDKPQ